MEHNRGRGLPSLLAGGQLPGLTSSQPKAGPGLPPRGPNTQYRKMLQDNRASDFVQKAQWFSGWAITKIITTRVPGTSHRKKSRKESADSFPPFLNLDKQHLPQSLPLASTNNAMGKYKATCALALKHRIGALTFNPNILVQNLVYSP